VFAEEQRLWIARQQASIRETVADRTSHTPEAVREWRRQASQELPGHLERLATHHGLRVSRVSIRNQRSRWGSCSPSGHICLNWRLVLMPDAVRDYVLIHELMHLRRLDHSCHFWRLVAHACPGYETARQWLREHRHLLL
jgi:predicted metal-dependent hydrolase